MERGNLVGESGDAETAGEGRLAAGGKVEEDSGEAELDW